MKFKLLSSMAMLLVGMVFSIVAQAGEGHAMAKGVMAHGAWVRLVPPVAKNSAAYMELQNTGDEVLQVTSASSPVAEVVEVHQTTMVDGVMRMAEVKGLQVPVDGKVQLEPGGYHIMLIKLKSPLKKDQVVPLTLKFTTGQELTVSARVKAMQGKMQHQHKH
ncbi:MAG: copper chaperone PCu(A)C [Oceanospirillaceae bacterium]|nr:copper chaperone PCu(A)C [Oceanospirillaceae bacterium]